MKCQFVVGQHVVCVSDDWHSAISDYLPEHLPAKNNKYSIRGFETFDDSVYLQLNEIRNSPGPFNHEATWRFDYFRPLNERPVETDISIFKKLLVPSTTVIIPEKEDVT